MTDKHLSTQFDAELSDVSTRVLEMGGPGRVAGGAGDLRADTVQRRDGHARCWCRKSASTRWRSTSTAICRAIIARRQPTARDLRLLIAIRKTIANLERVGDEAARIARTVQRLINTGVSSRMRLPVDDVSFEAEPGHRLAAQGARCVRAAGHRRGRSK